MKKALFVLALAASAARADDAVPIAWKAAEGDAFAVHVTSERHSEMQTAGEPAGTDFKLAIAGELRVKAVAADGARTCEFVFESLDGTIGWKDVTLPVEDKENPVKGKIVALTIAADGKVAWDRAALKQINKVVNLNEDLASLFPLLPGKPVAAAGTWSGEVDRRTDALALKSVSGGEGQRVAAIEGTSKADETNSAGDITASHKAGGTLSGEWNVDGGFPRKWHEERSEESSIVSKSSTLTTRSKISRTVELAPKK